MAQNEQTFEVTVDGSTPQKEENANDIWNQLPVEVKKNVYLSSLRKTDFKSSSLPTSPNFGRKECLLSPVKDLQTTEDYSSSSVLISSNNNVALIRKKSSKRICKKWNYLKTVILLIIWFIFTFILMTKSERSTYTVHQISVPRDKFRTFWILESPNIRSINVELGGSLLPSYYGNLSKYWANVWIEVVQTDFSDLPEKHISYIKRVTDVWRVPIVSDNLIDFVPEVKRNHIFNFYQFDKSLEQDGVMRVVMKTNLNRAFPISLAYQFSPIDPSDGIIYAALVLLVLYLLIIFEIVHRTLAAAMAATMSVSILALFDARPSLSEMVTWVDIETLLLLFSMMVLVTIFSETGVFDYLAVCACKITGGKMWPLIHTLCAFTAFISSFLDNVTTSLFMTPVTIRLCEVVGLNPVPVLMAVVIFSNLGGALTPVGDPPNVIIATNKDVLESGVSFGVFTLHMGTGIFLVMIFVYFQLRFLYRDEKILKHEDPKIEELKHEIEIWQRAAASLSSYTKDEYSVKATLNKRVRRLIGQLEKELINTSTPRNNYEAKLQELEEKYPIRDLPLLIKSTLTLCFVLPLFFLHSVPELNLSLGWSALLGVMFLLIITNEHNLESVLARVEWSTLIFFAALFVLMEALSRLGLIDCIGQYTQSVILSVAEEYRLTVAIVLILWVSALASSFVDNIPLTTMMIRIVTSLSQNQELKLPLQPLVWSLALGACLGGNGTLIGASANVVCAGVAEQHGYRFSFLQFFRVGFPIMLGSVTITTGYLLVAHVAIGWIS